MSDFWSILFGAVIVLMVGWSCGKADAAFDCMYKGSFSSAIFKPGYSVACAKDFTKDMP